MDREGAVEWNLQRCGSCEEVAEWLESHAAEGDCVMLDEVGVIGYHTRLAVLDTNGLVTTLPEEMRQRHSELLREYRPDFFVESGLGRNGTVGGDTLSGFGPLVIESDVGISVMYDPVYAVGGYSQFMPVIFRRRDP